MKRVKAPAIVVLVFMASGCATSAGKHPPSGVYAKDAYYDTQVSIGRCPSEIGGAESGLAAAFAAAAISKGVAKIGEALQAAAKTESHTALAQRNIEIRTSKPLGPCIVVVRGWFSTTVNYRLPEGAPTLPVGRKAKYHDALTPVGMNIAAEPDFFFEGRLRQALSGSAYAIQPSYAFLNEPIGGHALRPSKKRNVAIAFALADAGAAVDAAKTGAVLKLGRLVPGRPTIFSEEPCSAASDETVAAGTCPKGSFDLVIRNPRESHWFKLEATEKTKPMTLYALTTETRDESKFLQFVSAVFGASSDAITTAAQEKLITSEREEAELADLASDAAKANEYDKKLAAAHAVLSACIETPADTSKRLAARVAIRDFIAAARVAEKSDLTLDPEAISYVGDSAEQCRTERDKIR